MNNLELIDIDFIYPKSNKIILREVNIKFKEGSITSITGESGAGKSTLLYIISGFSNPNAGVLKWNGKNITNLEEYRRDIVGTISQSYLLFPNRTVLENVQYPLLLKKYPIKESIKKSKSLLESVGIMNEHFNKLPEKLSGGEQQRVAIARCLAADSKVIVADEPTGNLDEKNTSQIINIFKDLAYNQKKIVIIVTHNISLANKADTRYNLVNGKLLK